MMSDDKVPELDDIPEMPDEAAEHIPEFPDEIPELPYEAKSDGTPATGDDAQRPSGIKIRAIEPTNFLDVSTDCSATAKRFVRDHPAPQV